MCGITGGPVIIDGRGVTAGMRGIADLRGITGLRPHVSLRLFVSLRPLVSPRLLAVRHPRLARLRPAVVGLRLAVARRPALAPRRTPAPRSTVARLRTPRRLLIPLLIPLPPAHTGSSMAMRSAAIPREPYAFTEPNEMPRASATWASVMSEK